MILIWGQQQPFHRWSKLSKDTLNYLQNGDYIPAIMSTRLINLTALLVLEIDIARCQAPMHRGFKAEGAPGKVQLARAD
jgi:hypothetical protein